MKGDITVVLFDLFFTLVTPKYNDLRNENDVLKISMGQGDRY
jgi:putative hydrolase of the HAD superfamily